MIRTAQNAKNVLTLFHVSNSPVSRNIKKLLQTKIDPAHEGFDVEIVEAKPTADQVKTIEQFLKNNGAGASALTRPLLVDWFNGRVAINDDAKASEILTELLKQQQQQQK